MDYTEFKTQFDSAMRQNGLQILSDQQTEQMWRFAEYLLQVNQTTNLTAIRSMPDVITKHFVDSLLAIDLFPENATVLDLGCGAGFPSIPLAIARPDLRLTALDSTGKKISFVKSATDMLGLKEFNAITGRAEDPVLAKQLGKFDVVTSRAVARLNILSELCMPYLKIGGKFLALKAAKGDEELAEAKRGLSILGGREATVHAMSLKADDASELRCIIEVTKVKETPKNYPRSYSAIVKKPL